MMSLGNTGRDATASALVLGSCGRTPCNHLPLLVGRQIHCGRHNDGIHTFHCVRCSFFIYLSLSLARTHSLSLSLSLFLSYTPAHSPSSSHPPICNHTAGTVWLRLNRVNSRVQRRKVLLSLNSTFVARACCRVFVHENAVRSHVESDVESHTCVC
jgi:hypothetical protein